MSKLKVTCLADLTKRLAELEKKNHDLRAENHKLRDDLALARTARQLILSKMSARIAMLSQKD